MAISRILEIKFENNKSEVESDLKIKEQKILYAIGLKWQEICTKIITRNGIVDTGRLRASLTFITSTKRGGPISFAPNSKPSDFLKGSSGGKEVIVGSNVVYALRQEIENKKGAFLKPSILNYREDYENVTKSILEE